MKKLPMFGVAMSICGIISMLFWINTDQLAAIAYGITDAIILLIFSIVMQKRSEK